MADKERHCPPPVLSARRGGVMWCGAERALGWASRELLAPIQAAQLISRSCGAFPTTQPFVVVTQL